VEPNDDRGVGTCSGIEYDIPARFPIASVNVHAPSPRDGGPSTTWQPQEVWTFLTQF
jgi:hypothetical protein